MTPDLADSTEVLLEPTQRPFDPTSEASTPSDWEATVDALAPEVAGGGGTGGDPQAVARMVQIARSQLGVSETPPGSNAGKPWSLYIQYFGASLGHLPWCAFFVSWAWDQATDQNHRTPWPNPGYVGSVHAWATQAGRVVSSPIHGDLFGLSDQHMGVVVGSDPDRRAIYTVEGNYGDRVAGVNRNWAGLWFARLG